MYLPDVPAAQSLLPIPDATAGLGYDSATRSYVDRMGRLMNASQTPRGLSGSMQSAGRVLERLVNGPGDNSTGISQAARSAKAQSFGKNLRGSIFRGIGRTGMLGLGAAGVYGLGVGANGLGVNLADYLFDSKDPTIGVESNYLDVRPDVPASPTGALTGASLGMVSTRPPTTATGIWGGGWLGGLSGSDSEFGGTGGRQLLF